MDFDVGTLVLSCAVHQRYASHECGSYSYAFGMKTCLYAKAGSKRDTDLGWVTAYVLGSSHGRVSTVRACQSLQDYILYNVCVMCDLAYEYCSSNRAQRGLETMRLLSHTLPAGMQANEELKKEVALVRTAQRFAEYERSRLDQMNDARYLHEQTA